MASLSYSSGSRVQEAATPRLLSDVGDGELLDLFISQKDEAAFAELVARHGGMVLGVCRRVLHNPHDAEDCFQAAFLVLVRKAETIRPREMVGNWLYGVAYRTALEAKKMAGRRRALERLTQETLASGPAKDATQDLIPVLDEELSRLPDKYRVVLVLSDLEGKTRQEVAELLGLPEGTVASRLARGRALLAKRLRRHSLSFSAKTLPAALAEQASSAGVPAPLAAATVSAALQSVSGRARPGAVSAQVANLTDAVVRAMSLTRANIALAALALLLVVGFGIHALFPSLLEEETQAQPSKPVAARPAKPASAQPVEAKDCVIQKIDLANQTILATRVSADAGSEALDLQVGPATKIIIDDHDAKLADLHAGSRIHVQYERSAASRPRALKIEAAGEVVEGLVQAMDEAGITIQEDDKTKGIIAKTYELYQHVWVVIHGKKAKLAELKPHMKVALHVSTKKPLVVGIAAAGPHVDGVIQAIDVEKRTLSLKIDQTHLSASGVAIAADAQVLIGGRPANLAELQPGTRVRVQMSAESDRSVIIAITALEAR